MGMPTFSKAYASENAQVQNPQGIKFSFSPLTGSRKNGSIGYATGALTKIKDRGDMT